ncbi:MAG TPA: sigma-54 dependent transcriptional regulator [Rhodocyclaceae bacterium]|nr:sigma-54 dependent transcriptional regulator [Rhodocyclaceae bacterium]
MASRLNLLVVEDDAALLDALLITLETAGHRVTGAPSGPHALQLLERNDYQMVISDLRMEPMDGLRLLAEIRGLRPGLPVLLMTAFGDVDKAVLAMRGGACDFMLKPFESRDLLAQIDRYAVVPAAEGVVAEDRRTRDLLLLAARVARTDATVLLTGESGTGKEVLARYIHDQSLRGRGPFVAINCAAIPENLLEATFFGHEKGAFTGAQSAQPGKFEQADGGTLLLDEISEMPLALQAKLLRVLQEREVERVGGRKPVAVDIRVLATSNRNMAEEVRQGRFRQDLYYRLNVFPLEIPPLRDRQADIVALARYHLQRQTQMQGGEADLAPATAASLAAYSWPGNVRELENVIQRALILANGGPIKPEHLLLGHATGVETTTVSSRVTDTSILAERSVQGNDVALPEPISAGAAVNMRDLERQHILDTLIQVGGSRRRAVEILGISERTLRYKLAQYRQEGYWNEG